MIGAKYFLHDIYRKVCGPAELPLLARHHFHKLWNEEKYRKYPRIMRTFSTKILTSKLGVHIICGYISIHVGCWKILHLWFKSWGAHYTWVFTVRDQSHDLWRAGSSEFVLTFTTVHWPQGNEGLRNHTTQTEGCRNFHFRFCAPNFSSTPSLMRLFFLLRVLHSITGQAGNQDHARRLLCTVAEIRALHQNPSKVLNPRTQPISASRFCFGHEQYSHHPCIPPFGHMQAHVTPTFVIDLADPINKHCLGTNSSGGVLTFTCTRTTFWAQSRKHGARILISTTRTFVVDLAVAVDVGLADHLVHLLVRQLLAQVRHDVSQLRSADEAVTVLVEHSARKDGYNSSYYARREHTGALSKFCVVQ